jgi:hypothetical protein
MRVAAQVQHTRVQRGTRCCCGRPTYTWVRGHALCQHAWNIRVRYLRESERARRHEERRP